MSNNTTIKQQNKKPLSYWWILVIYSIILIPIIYGSLLINTRGNLEFEWENIVTTIWIPYLLLYIVKQIRNRQIPRKNVKIPLFMAMFVLPLFLFCVVWNFISLAIYVPNCFKTGRTNCLDWRLDLLITLPLQIIMNFSNAVFLSFKKYYWIWLNTFFALVFVVLFLVFGGLEDIFKIQNGLGYYLFSLFGLTGLVDLIFYLFYVFKKPKN